MRVCAKAREFVHLQRRKENKLIEASSASEVSLMCGCLRDYSLKEYRLIIEKKSSWKSELTGYIGEILV